MYAHCLKNILILPRGFKESCSATQVAEAIKPANSLPHALIKAISILDGGEETAHILAEHTQDRIIHTTIIGPLGQPISSYFAMLINMSLLLK